MNSDIIKSPKIADKFICGKCNYKCSKQSDFYKHSNTAKHINRINGTQKSQKSPKKHICVCGKEYKYSRGLWEHKKKCSKMNGSMVVSQASDKNQDDKPSVMEIITQNKEIMNLLVLQNEELKRQNKEQSDTIRELIPKIGNNNNNTTNNTKQ